MKKLNLLIVLLAIISSCEITAQISINSDGTSADNSAMLEVKSTAKGLLIPRMTAIEISEISSPANGLQAFNIDDSKLYIYVSSVNKWKEVKYGTGFIPGPFTCGDELTDIDGNTYNTILIGTQCWMKENLKTTSYSNGTPIPNITDETEWEIITTGAYSWYNHDINLKNSYGALYNWHATIDDNGLCPISWHVPSHNEWTTLTDYIGGTSYPHSNELKSCRQINSPLGGACNTTVHPRWDADSNYGIDSYYFSALPGGQRFDTGSFGSIGQHGHWWSSTEYPSTAAYSRGMVYNTGVIGVSVSSIQRGYSIRCLKD